MIKHKEWCSVSRKDKRGLYTIQAFFNTQGYFNYDILKKYFNFKTKHVLYLQQQLRAALS